MTRVLALYLPQFHQTRENDEWWGEGFTEWNVVRKAKSLSPYSIQPRVPENGYYDLSDVNDIRKQAELANEYGVDGFVIYSYYSNGKLLLNKPAELILENPDINISYCFSWANHDWMRTWFSYNKEMLRKQEYASNREQVMQHFCYLLPYFNDDRYIKVNNRPVLFIYDYEAFPDFELYKTEWNKLAIENGFAGLHLVQTLGGHHLEWNTDLFDSCFNFEPTYTTFLQMQKDHKINRIRRAIKKVFKTKWIPNYFDYNRICSYMESRNEDDKNHYLGAFAEWDNTPRHKDNGTIYKNFSIDRFKKNLEALLFQSVQNNKDFLIIDAWNEWGEGAFLEPDEYYHYQKLEAIREAKKKVLNDGK